MAAEKRINLLPLVSPPLVPKSPPPGMFGCQPEGLERKDPTNGPNAHDRYNQRSTYRIRIHGCQPESSHCRLWLTKQHGVQVRNLSRPITSHGFEPTDRGGLQVQNLSQHTTTQTRKLKMGGIGWLRLMVGHLLLAFARPLWYCNRQLCSPY